MIVVHVGGVERGVKKTSLVFKLKTNSADYHDEMNHQYYI